MASVRDNGATNNNDITTTPQQQFNIFEGEKKKLYDHVTNNQSIKNHDSTHISSFSAYSVIMDLVRRLQLAQLLLQLDDQQNYIAVHHQHQQVARQRRQRMQK